jgi:Tol biopolymer transport system component
MKRGRIAAASLVVLCLVTASCARLQANARARARALAQPTVDPSSAIALSVLGDSIYLIDPATGVTQTVARNLTDFQSGYAAWSPNHRFLAWGNGGITIMDVVTGKTTKLNTGQSLSMPAWSRDGKRIAFGDGTQLWIAKVSGGRALQLTVPPTIAPLAGAWSPGATLAFDGLQLDCVDGASCVSTDSSEIWTMRPDGTGLRQITHVGHAENPKWSPDGTQILFIRRFTRSKAPRSELWVVGSNGSGARRLADATDVVAAAWSPAGREIAMVRKATLPNTLQVWIETADGTNLHPVGDVVAGTDATIDW